MRPRRWIFLVIWFWKLSKRNKKLFFNSKKKKEKKENCSIINYLYQVYPLVDWLHASDYYYVL